MTADKIISGMIYFLTISDFIMYSSICLLCLYDIQGFSFSQGCVTVNVNHASVPIFTVMIYLLYEQKFNSAPKFSFKASINFGPGSDLTERYPATFSL